MTTHVHQAGMTYHVVTAAGYEEVDPIEARALLIQGFNVTVSGHDPQIPAASRVLVPGTLFDLEKS